MRNLYYENGLTSDGTVPRQLRIPRDKMHMVMVFGFIREGNTCIFNDPKCAPYLEADLRHLFDAACYLRPLEGDKFTFGDVLHPPSFLSVVPREVRLPLLSAYEDTELKQPVDGLFQIAMDVGWPSTDFRPEGIGGQADEAERAFLLTRIGDIQSRRHEFERMSALQLVDRLPDHLKKWSDEHWVWLELRKRGLLVWDAEASPGKWDGPDSGRSFLIEFGAVCAGDRIEWGQGNAQAEPRTYIPEIKRPTVLQESSETTIPALITSFARNALLRTGPTWCDKSVGVDLYCYQREEASELLPDCSLRKQSISRWLWRSIIQFNLRRFQNRPRLPVVRPDICICDWLAKKSGNDKYIQAATEALVKHLPKKPVACVAVSTFLPELAAHGERFRMRGVGALRFVLKLVGVLNSRYHCQIQTVELVGGSMVSNIQWEVVPSNDIEARGTTKNVFFARLDKEKARRQLYRSLQEVAADIPKNVLLALELEPGALGVIAGYGDLVALHKLLGDEACEFGDRIGFNCDIAHFTLAGITPTMLLADREGPLARITGFHLSDMGNGHFHDLVPGQAHPKAHFDDWRAVLEAAKKSPINARRSTLCISLELERSLGMSMVKDGVRTMKNFFC
jgi:sugar phosphate isomerase/epimerase